MSVEYDLLPTASDEQAQIIAKLNDGSNICIQAVAGAGKTTTLLLMALSQPDKNILIITYSKSLQLETYHKVKRLGLTNVDIKTIHSAAGYAYNMQGKIRDDKELLKLKGTPLPRHNNIDKYDIIMIDECQDIIDATRDFIYKIIQDKQVVIVGDPRQCIYEFNGASPEYLKHPDQYFNNGLPWETLYLTETYRFGPTIARFVNNHIVGSADDIPMIGKGATNGYVTIITNRKKILIDAIIDKVNIYGINNVAIIASTVNDKNKFIRGVATDIENKAGYSPVFVDGKSEKSTDNIEDRLYFGTIHSMKGLEKDVIFVLLDEGYLKCIYTEWNQAIYVPNLYYVAMTRAKQELIWYVTTCKLDGGRTITGLRSINANTINHDANKIYGQIDVDNRMHPIDQYNRTYYRGVSDMIEYRSVVDVVDMLSCFTYTTKQVSKSISNRFSSIFYIEYISNNKGKHNLKESVGYLYGIAIPKYVEYKITGQYHGLDMLLRDLIVSTYFLANKERLNLTNIEELKQRINKGDKRLISKLGTEGQDLVVVIKNSKSLQTHDLLDILEDMTEDKVKFNEISSIINNPNKTPYDIMKLVCLSQILTKPYLRNKLGNLSWINEDFLANGCQVLYDYIGEKGGKVKFETPVNITVNHPVLKHLKEPRVNDECIDVGFNYDRSIIEWYDLGENERVINTTNGAAVSFAEISLKGYVDCHLDNIPYEFKLSHELYDDHLIQLASYMIMGGKRVGYLFNYFTGLETKLELKDEMDVKFLSALFRKVYNWSSISTFEYNKQNDEEETEDEGVTFKYERTEDNVKRIQRKIIVKKG